MDSIRMVRIEDRLRLMIKLILGLLLKLIFLLIWGVSIWVFYQLLYDRYVLEAYPLGHYLPVLIFTFGNIWVLPWLILWCKSYTLHLIRLRYIMGLVIGMQVVSGYSYMADASWLSKTWDRLETNAAKQSYDWPKAEQYTHYAGGQVVGANLPAEDMMILGVSLGNTFDSVKASLGQPTKETSRGITYGGVTFGNLKMDGVGPIVTYMMIENRDAVTHRGIAVGDSMRKVLDVYGRPDLVDSNNRWFYGKYRYRTDIMHGIQFEQKGDKVCKILIYR